jgi:ankyrin repeat protein
MPDMNELNRSFMTAVREGDINALTVFIAAGLDVNLCDVNGHSPLYYAVEHAQVESIQILIAHGADVHTVNGSGESLLFNAAFEGHDKIIRILHNLGLDVKSSNRDLNTLLHIAAMRGHAKAIQTLVSLGAELNAKNKSGNTALHMAMRSGHTESVQALLDLGANPHIKNNKTLTALHIAAETGNVIAIKLLIKHIIRTKNGLLPGVDNKADSSWHDISIEFAGALTHAASEGHIEAIKTLAELGANINHPNWGSSAIGAAANNNQTHAVKVLVEMGADHDYSALNSAVKNGKNELVRLMLQLGSHLESHVPLERKLKVLARYTDNIYMLSPSLKPRDYDAYKDDSFIIERLYHKFLKSGVSVNFAESLHQYDLSMETRAKILYQAKIASYIYAIIHHKPIDISTLPKLSEAEENQVIEILMTQFKYGYLWRPNDDYSYDHLINLGRARSLGFEKLYHNLKEQPILKELVEKAISQIEGIEQEYRQFKLNINLIEAAAKGEIGAINEYITAGADYTFIDAKKQSALDWAAKYGRDEAIKVLVQLGANQAQINSALWQAATGNHITAIKTLVDLGANQEGKDQALLAAAENGHVELIRSLVEHGAQLENDEGDSALELATMNGHLEAMQILVELGADTHVALNHATSTLQAQAILLLVKLGANLGSGYFDRTFLLIAMDNAHKKEHLETIRVLCELYAELNPENPSNLTEALDLAFVNLKENRYNLNEDNSFYGAQIRILIEAGAKVGLSHLNIAASYIQDPEIFKLIISRGIDVNEKDTDGESPLSHAASTDNSKAVKILIDLGAKLTDSLKDLYELLDKKSHYIDISYETIKLLIASGLDFKSRKEKLTDCLQHAILYGHLGKVRALLELEPDIKARDADTRTPLHLAARAGDPEVIRPLLEYGAELHANDKRGNTVLHYAVSIYSGCNPTPMITSLHAFGANIEAKNTDNRTPLQLAAKLKNVWAVNALLELAADIRQQDLAIDEHIIAMAEFADSIYNGPLLFIPDSYEPQDDNSFIRERLYHRFLKSGFPSDFIDTLLHLDIPDSLKSSILSSAKAACMIRAVMQLKAFNSKEAELIAELSEQEQNQVIERLSFQLQHGLIGKLGLVSFYDFINKQTVLKDCVDKALRQLNELNPDKFGIEGLYKQTKDNAEICLGAMVILKYPDAFPINVPFSLFKADISSPEPTVSMPVKQSYSGLVTILGSTIKAFEHLILKQTPSFNRIPEDKRDYLIGIIETLSKYPALSLPCPISQKLKFWLSNLEKLQAETPPAISAGSLAGSYATTQSFGGSAGAAGGSLGAAGGFKP